MEFRLLGLSGCAVSALALSQLEDNLAAAELSLDQDEF
jgi:hypothetical protein